MGNGKCHLTGYLLLHALQKSFIEDAARIIAVICVQKIKDIAGHFVLFNPV
ncbi:Uncharacterised protein [Mycobacteroides abscessus subsp. abscessus]|nr:Uncharacterised protein [Mycobacteroides abscessus subsp. abscessus]